MSIDRDHGRRAPAPLEQFQAREAEERSKLKERDARLIAQLLNLTSQARPGKDFDAQVGQFACEMAQLRIELVSSIDARGLLNCGLYPPLLPKLSEALANEIARLPSRRRSAWEEALRHAAPPQGRETKILACAVALELPGARARAEGERIAKEVKKGDGARRRASL